MKKTIQLLQQTQDFLTHYHQFLSFRMDGLYNGARGNSRFMSLWITYIAKQNVEKELDKINQRLLRLQQDTSQTWFYQLCTKILPSRMIQRWRIHPSEVNQILAERFSAKTLETLLRAEEVLSEQVKISDLSAKTIPVPPHVEQFERAKSCLDKLQSIKESFSMVFNKAEAHQQKSWLSNVLKEGRALVGMRVASYGLSKDRVIAGIQAEDTKICAQEIMEQLQDLLNADNRISLPMTKMTSKLLGIAKSTDEPISALHHEHFPPRAEIVAAFRKLQEAPELNLQDQVVPELKQDEPEFKTIFDTLKVNFPEPKVRLR